MNKILLTDDELQIVLNTFKSSGIRIREWIKDAKATGKINEVAKWESILAKKERALENIKKQMSR